ncbi:MAG TPA: hypothetical protein VM925_09170 [Labilithrix sp.]|jgi:hypothetical protein|nr:hypothetical protein [Labilithrix sp.]
MKNLPSSLRDLQAKREVGIAYRTPNAEVQRFVEGATGKPKAAFRSGRLRLVALMTEPKKISRS